MGSGRRQRGEQALVRFLGRSNTNLYTTIEFFIFERNILS
jgi:hypothetical protein